MVHCHKLHCRTLAFLLLTLLCSCAGSADSGGNSGTARLPQLPAGLLDRHRVAQVQTTNVDGADVFIYSPSAATVGSALQLTAAAGSDALEWAVWKLPLSAGTHPLSVAVDISVDSGSSAWLGVADYSNGVWQLSGPFNSGLQTIGALGAGNVSPGGNVFVLAAAYNGTQLTVNSLAFENDVPAPPKYFITGNVSDTTLKELSGIVMTLNPGNLKATTNSIGNYTFLDLDPGMYTVSPPNIDAHDVDPLNFPVDLTSGNFANADFTYTQQDPGITYTNTIKLLLDTKCVSCHNPSDPNRSHLDVYIRGDSNDVWHNAEDSLAYILSNWMPPGDPLNMSQKQLFDDWINVYNKAE